jgi:hypothetical protein
MNDTVKLSFLLMKIKLLLKLAKYGTARELLTEANTLLQLVLKNKRILVFIEEESNLLTYYSQEILDLEAEYYFNNNESKKALEYSFLVLVALGLSSEPGTFTTRRSGCRCWSA